MDYDRAAILTRNVAFLQRSNWREAPCPEMTFDHVESMMSRWSDDMSATKKCRWLGWMQATVVSMTYPYTSLETMKQINIDCSGPTPKGEPQ